MNGYPEDSRSFDQSERYFKVMKYSFKSLAGIINLLEASMNPAVFLPVFSLAQQKSW